MKKFKGFTLVELIVVIAIIGVLAAILVPNMMGYISKSKLSSANTAAKNVQTALVTYKADQASMGNDVTIACAGDVWEVAATGGDAQQAAVYTALSGNSKMGVVAFGEDTMSNSEKVVWAQWGDVAKKDDSTSASVWGQYPNAQADYTTYKAATDAKFGTFVKTWTAASGS